MFHIAVAARADPLSLKAYELERKLASTSPLRSEQGMSESALVPIEEDEELRPRVLKLRLPDRPGLMIPVHQVHKALDAVLPTVDANCRRRAIAESLVTIDTVTAEHMKTIADAESASIVIRGVCERSALLDVAGSSDPVQLSMQPTTQLSSTDPIRVALERLRDECLQLPRGNSNSE
jgi:hypothetical protein